MGALCICSMWFCSMRFIVFSPVQLFGGELMLASRVVHAKPLFCALTCDGISVVGLALAMQTLEALYILALDHSCIRMLITQIT